MSPRIVLIDDETNLRQNMTDILETAGYVVFGAADADAGLALIRDTNPDAILCDVALPGNDGFYVLEQVGQLARVVPFIFVTARVENSDFRKGMALGADDYLFKPFTGEELLTAIQARLDKYRRILGRHT